MGYANGAGTEVLTGWRKSAHSGNGGNCVELAVAVAVRS